MRLMNKIRDIITLIILAGFLLGCYATTHRGPRTLDPGQVSASTSYLRFKGTEADPDDDPNKLVGVEGRAGLVKGIDIGFMRTFDISEGVESGEGIDTYWFDSKFQLLNRNNLLNKPTMSLGYGFGKLVNEDDLWVNTLYLLMGGDSYHLMGGESKNISLFYSFRYEWIDEEINWIPSWAWEEDFNEIRKAHIMGIEYEINKNFKPVIEIGRFYEEDFSDGLNVLTAGINLYMK